MFVNPVGSIIGQLLQRGKVDNWREVKGFWLWGLGLGPAAHVWNNILQHWTDKYRWNLAVKLLVDHICWKECIIYIFCWYSQLLVNKKPISEIQTWLRQNFWNFPSGLLVSSLYVWIPVQVVNLYWVPLPFRVLYMNVSVMIWTVYLAAKLNRKAPKPAALHD